MRLTCDHSARSRLRTQYSVKTENVHYGFNPAINIRLGLRQTHLKLTSHNLSRTMFNYAVATINNVGRDQTNITMVDRKPFIP